MKIKPLTVGNTRIDGNVFLAPIAGYTDLAFRTLAISLGAPLTFTELVSAKGLCYGGEGSISLIKTSDYSKSSVQLFGSEPEFIKRAAESELLKDYNLIDINMGCPVPKVFKNGEGSALLLDIKKAEKVVRAAVSSGKTVSIKIRTGQKQGDDVSQDFAKMAEQAGAAFVTIHARVREAYYSGEPDYNAIYKAKLAVKIPIIANGGIFTEKDADQMIDKTGADGVMIARGALFDPLLISKIVKKEPSLSFKQVIFKHLDLLKRAEGENRAAVLFRKFITYYLKGIKGNKVLRAKIMTAENTIEIKNFLSEIL